MVVALHRVVFLRVVKWLSESVEGHTGTVSHFLLGTCVLCFGFPYSVNSATTLYKVVCL